LPVTVRCNGKCHIGQGKNYSALHNIGCIEVLFFNFKFGFAVTFTSFSYFDSG
jgi:hypothetical protein